MIADEAGSGAERLDAADQRDQWARVVRGTVEGRVVLGRERTEFVLRPFRGHEDQKGRTLTK